MPIQVLPALVVSNDEEVAKKQLLERIQKEVVRASDIKHVGL
jgi:hypothetical protein